jgi:hypothetical protein
LVQELPYRSLPDGVLHPDLGPGLLGHPHNAEQQRLFRPRSDGPQLRHVLLAEGRPFPLPDPLCRDVVVERRRLRTPLSSGDGVEGELVRAKAEVDVIIVIGVEGPAGLAEVGGFLCFQTASSTSTKSFGKLPAPWWKASTPLMTLSDVSFGKAAS